MCVWMIRTRCSELPGPSFQVGLGVVDVVAADDDVMIRESLLSVWSVDDDVDVVATAGGLGLWVVVFLLLLMLVVPSVLWRMSFSRAWMCREELPFGGWETSSAGLGWRDGAIDGRVCDI